MQLFRSKNLSMIKITNKATQTIIQLEPNRSASWNQTKQVILWLSGFMLIIATGWMIAGVWLILPFFLLDIMLFTYLFYRVSEATYQRQFIIIDKERVQFRAGIHRLGTAIVFLRPCYLLVHKRTARGHLPAFSVSDDDKTQRIGNFLNEEDLILLRKKLTEFGLIEVDQQWWQGKPP